MRSATKTLTTENRSPDAPLVPVWDPFVRLFHWSLALGFAVSYLTEDDLLNLHVWAGYLVLVLVGLRFVWGFVGTRYARWSDFLKAPGDVLAYLRDAVRLRAARHLGHNPAGGAMIVALLLSLAATALTGLALYGAQELSGPLAMVMSKLSGGWAHALEDAHEVLANLTLLLVGLHLAGVVLSSLQHGENLVRSMVTGYKRSEAS
jgi:cytochrome b